MALPPKIESRTGVRVPAHVVWEAISEIGDWPSWNPLYPKAEGMLRIGAKLNLTLALPGEPEREFSAAVVDWVPNEQILWADTLARGWVKTLRYIEVEALTDASSIFSNGEQFQGFVAPWYMTKARRRRYREAFTALCDAVRGRRRGGRRNARAVRDDRRPLFGEDPEARGEHAARGAARLAGRLGREDGQAVRQPDRR